MPRIGAGGWAAVLTVAALGGGSATAQEVAWRHDYPAARREAAAAGKPLLLDFGTENCVWCRRLDVTFRDPAVAGRLNARFIPVKIDAERDEELTRAMGVTGFPTLVIAGPDGRVVGRKDGYADAPTLLALLRPAAATRLAPPAAPERPARDRIAAQLDALYPVLDAALRK